VKKVPFAHPDQHISLIALCLATTLLIKMPKTKYLFVTLVPLCLCARYRFCRLPEIFLSR
jgi:carbon starvation protein CstA